MPVKIDAANIAINKYTASMFLESSLPQGQFNLRGLVANINGQTVKVRSLLSELSSHNSIARIDATLENLNAFDDQITMPTASSNFDYENSLKVLLDRLVSKSIISV